MKTLLLGLVLTCSVSLCFGQKGLISYDDLKFLVRNNLEQADTFLMVKGYVISQKNNNTKNRSYSVSNPDGTYTNVSLRLDGKKLYVEIESNFITQYNIIRESILPFLDKSGSTAGIQIYNVKDIGNIYITMEDSVTVDPLKKEFDIQVVVNKHVVTNN